MAAPGSWPIWYGQTGWTRVSVTGCLRPPLLSLAVGPTVPRRLHPVPRRASICYQKWWDFIVPLPALYSLAFLVIPLWKYIAAWHSSMTHDILIHCHNTPQPDTLSQHTTTWHTVTTKGISVKVTMKHCNEITCPKFKIHINVDILHIHYFCYGRLKWTTSVVPNSIFKWPTKSVCLRGGILNLFKTSTSEGFDGIVNSKYAFSVDFMNQIQKMFGNHRFQLFSVSL